MYGTGEPIGPFGTAVITEPLAPVLATFAGPAPQRRLTVLVRFILAIPHLACLAALGVAAEFVAIIGWFGALFTGRLPGFAADFLGGYLHWQFRVSAYTALMTDVYPPFAFGDAPYPVRIAFRPGRLNRLAVLFRVFLVFPAGLVADVLELGAFTIMGVVTWLIVLVRGTMPEPLYQAYAAVLRYVTRYTGYLLMLTSAYPAGLFGDTPPAPPAFAGTAPAWGAPRPGPAAPEDDLVPEADLVPESDQKPEPDPVPEDDQKPEPDPASEADQQAGTEPGAEADPRLEPDQAATADQRTEADRADQAAEPGLGVPGQAPGEASRPWGAPGEDTPGGDTPTWGAPAPPPPPPPDPWLLVLSRNARTLVWVIIAVGVLGVGGIVAGNLAVSATHVNAIVQVDNAYHLLDTQLTAEASKADGCGSSDVSCATGVMGSVANSYHAFAATVSGVSMPSDAASSARTAILGDAGKLASDYQQLAGAGTVDQFNALTTSLGVSNDNDKFRADSAAFATALGSSVTG